MSYVEHIGNDTWQEVRTQPVKNASNVAAWVFVAGLVATAAGAIGLSAPRAEHVVVSTEETERGGYGRNHARLLAEGMEGEDVAHLQNELIRMGYLSEDEIEKGVFDARTTHAVKLVERDCHDDHPSVKVDGVSGPKVLECLAENE